MNFVLYKLIECASGGRVGASKDGTKGKKNLPILAPFSLICFTSKHMCRKEFSFYPFPYSFILFILPLSAIKHVLEFQGVGLVVFKVS